MKRLRPLLAPGQRWPSSSYDHRLDRGAGAGAGAGAAGSGCLAGTGSVCRVQREAASEACACEGALIFVDPDRGAVQGQTELKAGVSLPPVVANNMLYVLDDDGRLHAFR